MKIPEDFQVAEDDMEKPTNLKELIKAYVDFHKNKKKVEKVDKLGLIKVRISFKYLMTFCWQEVNQTISRT